MNFGGRESPSHTVETEGKKTILTSPTYLLTRDRHVTRMGTHLNFEFGVTAPVFVIYQYSTFSIVHLLPVSHSFPKLSVFIFLVIL